MNSASGVRRRVCVNGRFLTQTTSGVQRFCRELMAAVDEHLHRHAGDEPAQVWELWVPAGARDLPSYRAIRIRHFDEPAGHAWDQRLRRHAEPEDILVNLANGGPILRGNSLSVIHDAAVYRTPANFTRAYAFFHRMLGRLVAWRSRVCTVSEFSRGELAEIFGLCRDDIAVVPNGGEHLTRVTPDDGVVDRLGLRDRGFFLFIGSPAPNKNLRTAIEAFADPRLQDWPFVIVGSLDLSVFGTASSALPANVRTTGRLSDEEVAGLLRHARALVFPSLYEGFGIPPLEAMLAGCPVLASDIPPVREVCGQAAWFFDPRDAKALAALVVRAIEDEAGLRALSQQGSLRSRQFTWARSAQALLEVVGRMVCSDPVTQTAAGGAHPSCKGAKR